MIHSINQIVQSVLNNTLQLCVDFATVEWSHSGLLALFIFVALPTFIKEVCKTIRTVMKVYRDLKLKNKTTHPNKPRHRRKKLRYRDIASKYSGENSSRANSANHINKMQPTSTNSSNIRDINVIYVDFKCKERFSKNKHE